MLRVQTPAIDAAILRFQATGRSRQVGDVAMSPHESGFDAHSPSLFHSQKERERETHITESRISRSPATATRVAYIVTVAGSFPRLDSQCLGVELAAMSFIDTGSSIFVISVCLRGLSYCFTL